MLCGSTVTLRLILLHAAFLIAEKPSLEIPEQKGPIGILVWSMLVNLFGLPQSPDCGA